MPSLPENKNLLLVAQKQLLEVPLSAARANHGNQFEHHRSLSADLAFVVCDAIVPFAVHSRATSFYYDLGTARLSISRTLMDTILEHLDRLRARVEYPG